MCTRFGVLRNVGPLLYERSHDSAPIKACDATLLRFSSRTYRVIIIYAPSVAPAGRTRDSTPSTPLSLVSSDSPSTLRAFNVLLSFPVSSSFLTRFSVAPAERAVIPADKSSDVISRRQRISRRLNVSQEGERSAISLCSAIYIRARPELSRARATSSSLFLSCFVLVVLDKVYFMDLSSLLYRAKEGNVCRRKYKTLCCVRAEIF